MQQDRPISFVTKLVPITLILEANNRLHDQIGDQTHPTTVKHVDQLTTNILAEIKEFWVIIKKFLQM